jgi:hypothetical protein
MKLRAKIKLKEAIAEVHQRLDDVALQLASEQRANILMRVRKGMGIHGQMPGYSAMTATMRRRRGRQTSVRDLQMTGMMLRDLHAVRAGRGRAALRFRSSTQRLKAIANQRRSAWFGMTDADRQALTQTLLELGAKRRR